MRSELALVVCLLSAALGGCAVTSEQPLFAVEQAPKHPMRDGLWAVSGPGCEVTPLKSAEPLPECVAMSMTVTGRRMTWELVGSPGGVLSPAQLKSATASAPNASDFVVADGDPAIIEVLNGQTAGFAGTPPPTAGAIKVGYLSLHTLEQDAQGRIVRGVMWSIPCPDDPKTPGFKAPSLPTGLGGAGACRAETPEAVRAQATHLKPFMSFFVTWVR